MTAVSAADTDAAGTGTGTGGGEMVRRRPHVGGRGSGVPARGYSWKPFEKGHAAPLKGGWKSPRVYNSLAAELAAGLLDSRPDLANYPEAVAAWAESEALCVLLRRRLAQTGIADDDAPGRGRPRGRLHTTLLEQLRLWDRRAAAHRTTLGLDPRSEAALARERAAATAAQAVDLTALAEEGRRVLAEREARGELPPPDLAGDIIERVRAEGRAAMDAAARDSGTGTGHREQEDAR